MDNSIIKYSSETIFLYQKNNNFEKLPDEIIKKIDKIYKNINSRIIKKTNYNDYYKYNKETETKILIDNSKKIESEIIIILNKISKNNLQQCLNSLNKIIEKEKNKSIYNKFITENIFNNTIKQPLFCSPYIQILTYFKDTITIQEKINLYLKFIDNEKNNQKLRYGYSYFISSLYNYSLMDEFNLKNILNTIIDRIQNIKINCEDNVEYLVIISKTINKKNIIKPFIPIIISLTEDKNISNKLKFKLMDIKDSY